MWKYVPYPKQKRFHESLSPIRAIFGGNRSGKSTAGCLEFLYHMTQEYPDWYPEEGKIQPKDGLIKGRIFCTDFQKGLGEIIQPLLDEWLNPYYIKKKYRSPLFPVYTKYELHNLPGGHRAVFDVLTHVQDDMQAEGWKGHVAWFDEPPPRSKYIGTRRGLIDYSGRCFMTLTPLTQPWIYDEIYCKADGKKVTVITTDIRDNPYLSEEAIVQFEEDLDPDEREARIKGKFLHLTGLIYKEFNPDIHTINPFQIPKHWTRYFCVDPHPRKPSACLWLAVDPYDNHYIYNELWVPDLDLGQLAGAIHAEEGADPPHVRLIDPNADNTNTLAGGFNVKQELMKHSIFCQAANNDPNLGKSRIKAALKPHFNRLQQVHMPKLRVFNTCRRTIFEFTHYIWDNYRRNKEEYDVKELPKKKFDDMMDCLRYIYNYDPRYFNQAENVDDVRFEGEYTKYPVSSSKPNSGYYDLVDR